MVKYLLLDKNDITHVCGVISRQEAMKELDCTPSFFNHFIDYAKLFRNKYILVEEYFGECKEEQ